MSFFREVIKNGRLRVWSNYKDTLREQHPLRYLFWEATLNCNFFCKHCGSSAGRKVFKNELNTEEIKSAFKDIADNFNPSEITIAVTGGEPLLRRDIFEVMSYASSLGFKWGMVTNGYLVTKSVVKILKKSGLKTVVVSIDGINAVHDSFRNMSGAYKKAINAVRLFAEADFLQDLQITTMVFPENIDSLEEMYQTFLPTGISSWRLIEVDPIGRAENNLNILLKPDQLKKLLSFIKDKRKGLKTNISFGCSGFVGPEFEGEVRDWLFRCAAGITCGSILHNGDIFVCPNVPREKEIQGNVKVDSFSKIWDSKFNFFRNKKSRSNSECNSCDYKTECQYGSAHHWDFHKKQLKICYFKELEKT